MTNKLTELAPLFSLVEKYFGLDFEASGRESLISLYKECYSGYNVWELCKFLENSVEERRKLIERLIVPETWFFRDDGPFEYLSEFVKSRIITTPINILSAPCSTGEEPVSISISLKQSGFDDNFSIDAYDISRRSIETAKKGIYYKQSFRTANGERIKTYFEAEGQSGFKIKSEIVNPINYYEANFLENSFSKPNGYYDVIFCKNVLIYFTTEARKALISKLRSMLKDDGILFTGHAEMMILLQNGFTSIANSKAFACSKSKEKASSNVVIPKLTLISKTPVTKSHKNPHFAKENKEPFTKVKSIEPLQVNLTAVSSVECSITAESIRKVSDSGDLQGALAQCEKILPDCGRNTEINLLYASINFALNNNSIAEQYFNKVLYLEPNSYSAAFQLSLLYSQIGDVTKSAIYRDRAKRIFENNAKREGIQ